MGSRCFQRLELSGAAGTWRDRCASDRGSGRSSPRAASARRRRARARSPPPTASWTATTSWPSTTTPGIAVRGRAVGEVVDRRRVAHRRVLAVEVVLDHEDHRRAPDGGHVERLVERPDVRRAVAEERDAQRCRCRASVPTSRPRRRPASRPDDRERADQAEREVGEVHRAADAAAAAARCDPSARRTPPPSTCRAPARGRGRGR